MDEFLRYAEQVDPMWAVVLAAAALGILLVVRLWRSSFAYVLAGVLAFALVGGISAAGYYSYAYFEDQRRIEERRLLDERAEVLFTKTIEPDSVFACIDGSPAPAMREACERSLFAEPQRVAAAVAIVTRRIAFLHDALMFAAERDPSYAERIESMHNAVESDPFGFVAFVLSVEHGCTHEKCARFDMLRDPARVRENMRVRRLEAYLAKHSTNWRGSSESPAAPAPKTEGRTTSPIVTISEPAAPKGTTGEQGSAPAAEPVGAATNDPPKLPAILPLIPPPSAASVAIEPPAAAVAPVVSPAEAKDFADPPAPAETDAEPSRKKRGGEAEKGAAEGKGAAETAKSAARSGASTRAKPKAKARAAEPIAEPAARSSAEPVGGLPRVVPSDYVRDQEQQEETAAQTAVPAAGAPTPITPSQQNFTVN